MSFEVISVVGPTASGKSELALQLAEALDAEIINTDAMQLYAGMDIGTAKLTKAEMRGIPHHLISTHAPDQEISAVEFRELFDSAFSGITSRSKQIITVGGSTLYLSAALDQLSFSPTNDQVREKLERELETAGAAVLWQRLRQLDPDTAAKIPAGNPRRVIRALEVIELTGQRYPNTLPQPSYRRHTLQIGISVPRDVLLQRIEARVVKMWRDGLLDEVAKLNQKYPSLSRTARVAIGYGQASRQLAGEITEAEAIAETVQLTARYAKKQMTWFRRDSRIHWLDFSDHLQARALELIRLEQ